MSDRSWLEPLLSKKLLVMTGSGGVGKTTTSSAIAIEAAVRGQRVLVMTIDPAKRLADSLGLGSLGNQETRIDLAAHLPDEDVRGTLHAMMLDTKEAFDELVDRLARSEEEAEKVRGNPLFRLMIDQMAGVQEYLAGEKVYDTVSSGRYDMVVLDTPPTRNALDFLDAPGRLASLLDERVIRWFLPELVANESGAKMGLFRRLLSSSSNVVKRILGRVFGDGLIQEVEAFLWAMGGMRQELYRRYKAVQELMRSDDTAFLLVTGPSYLGVLDALFFYREITRRHLPLAGLIVNRVHPHIEDPPRWEDLYHELSADSTSLMDPDELMPIVRSLARNVEVMNRLGKRDRKMIDELLQRTGCRNEPLTVPLLPEEVYDIRALRRVARHLLEPGALA